MFAFAIWDRRRQMLFLARDRLGKKPLYYSYLGNGEVVFASEIVGLMANGALSTALSPTAIEDFLAYGYVPDPGSIYREISQLPAAHYLLLQRGRPLADPKPYWRPRFEAIPGLSEHDATEQLLDRLTQSVDRRLVADVPLGAFLSGGIDSGTIVALMAKLRSDPVSTFTMGFRGDADEGPFAAAVASRYATSHVLDHMDIDYIDAARKQASVFGEPFGDSSSVPTYQVARLARQKVTVALSGDGGDELFAGYRRYQWHLLAEAARRILPSTVRRSVVGRLAGIYPKLDRAPKWLRAKTTLTEISLDSALGYYRTVARTLDADRRQLMSPRLRGAVNGHDPAARITHLMDEADTEEPLARAQYVDMKTWLTGDILTKVDRTSMANSLEVRAPLLDHTFVEWAMRLPRSLLLHNGQRKYVLRRAAARLLPRQIIDRPKQGFARPLQAQFQGAGALRLRERLLGDVMADSGYFDLGTLSRWIDEHDRGLYDRSSALWSLLVFEGFLASRPSTAGI